MLSLSVANTHFAANAPGAGPLVTLWAIGTAPTSFGEFSNGGD
jgi:hypothetical protein